MIAEWFYPQELKSVVADLRAKGDLNEEVLRKVNNIPVFVFFLWLFVITFFWFGLEDKYYLIAAFCGTILVAISLMIVSIGWECKAFLTYHRGELKRGIFLRSKISGEVSSVSLIIRDPATKQKIRTYGVSYNLVEELLPKRKEIVTYYSLDGKFHMPDFKPIKMIYCLSLSKLIESHL